MLACVHAYLLCREVHRHTVFGENNLDFWVWQTQHTWHPILKSQSHLLFGSYQKSVTYLLATPYGHLIPAANELEAGIPQRPAQSAIWMKWYTYIVWWISTRPALGCTWCSSCRKQGKQWKQWVSKILTIEGSKWNFSNAANKKPICSNSEYNNGPTIKLCHKTRKNNKITSHFNFNLLTKQAQLDEQSFNAQWLQRRIKLASLMAAEKHPTLLNVKNVVRGCSWHFTTTGGNSLLFCLCVKYQGLQPH